MNNEQLREINEILNDKVKLYEMLINAIAKKAYACLASTKADYQSNVASLINDVVIINSSINGESNE